MVTLQSAKCLILASVQLIGNLSKGTMRSFIADLSILKAFNVTVHPPKAFSILQVDWIPPPCSWVKCNTMMLLKATLIPRPVVLAAKFRNSGKGGGRNEGKGAKVILGGKRHSLGLTFYEPTVINDVNSDMRISSLYFAAWLCYSILRFKLEIDAGH
ncbi:Metal tolerance protein C2 isoform D [Glycine soja]|uniref:Metal tolerance protein C2 isoform D n=1 Tax=Glycine soja TaxID=3848 RepID=A0A445FFX4_GLYSO|nr:Metal tolerance protein C2 isoform D [Glycine soja]